MVEPDGSHHTHPDSPSSDWYRTLWNFLDDSSLRVRDSLDSLWSINVYTYYSTILPTCQPLNLTTAHLYSIVNLQQRGLYCTVYSIVVVESIVIVVVIEPSVNSIVVESIVVEHNLYSIVVVVVVIAVELTLYSQSVRCCNTSRALSLRCQQRGLWQHTRYLSRWEQDKCGSLGWFWVSRCYNITVLLTVRGTIYSMKKILANGHERHSSNTFADSLQVCILQFTPLNFATHTC